MLAKSSNDSYIQSDYPYSKIKVEMESFFNILGWLLSLLTLAGNGFVVFLVAKNRRLHSSANWFVLSLAVADFGVGFAVFPSSYICISSMTCNSKVYMAFFWFFLHSSVTNLSTLTWDRYVAIIHPFKYNSSITERRPGMVILMAWLVSFAISLTLLVGMYATNSDTALKVLRLTGVSAFDIISCVLLFYAVIRILVVARAHSHQESAIEMRVQCNHTSSSPIEEESFQRGTNKHTAARFIIAIVVLYLGCYIVVSTVVLCIAFSCPVSDKAGQVVICLLVLNSAVNPLVYAFLKSDIKNEIRNLVRRENLRNDD